MKILYCFENNKYLIKLSKDNDQIKINFEGSDLYFVMYIENKANILKIPTDVFKNPATNSPFKNRDYVGLKSLPEYGIEMNKSNLNELLLYKVM